MIRIIISYLIISSNLIIGYYIKHYSITYKSIKLDNKLIRYRSKYEISESNKEDENLEIVLLATSMINARKNQEKKQSPGGGLLTAEEQADAAYADLINTTIDQRNIDSLSEEELKSLAKGANMWEKDALKQENKLGVIGDILNAFKALFGGAHIEKNKFGET